MEVQTAQAMMFVIGALCPGFLLTGLFFGFIIALQLGWGQYSESRTIDDVSPRQFQQLIDPYLSSGWDIAAVVQSEGQVGKLMITLRRKRRHLL